MYENQRTYTDVHFITNSALKIILCSINFWFLCWLFWFSHASFVHDLNVSQGFTRQGLTVFNFDRKASIIEFHPLKFSLGSYVPYNLQNYNHTITNLNNTNKNKTKHFSFLLIKILSSCKTFYSVQSQLTYLKPASYWWIFLTGSVRL